MDKADRDAGSSTQRMERGIHHGVASIDARAQGRSRRNLITTKQRDNRFQRQPRKIGVRAASNDRFAVEATGVLVRSARIDEIDRDLFERKRWTTARLAESEHGS